MNYTLNQVVWAIQTFLSEQNYNGFAIQCKTKENAELFLKSLSKLGREWKPEDPIVQSDGSINSKWNKNKEYTCYRFFIDEKNVLLARKQYYEKQNLEIIPFELLIKDFSFNETNENIPAESAESIKTVNPNTKSMQDQSLEEYIQVQNETASPQALNDPLFIICVVFNVNINEPFYINTLYDNRCNHNRTYRINSYGIREYQLDNNNWVSCNDENELLYLLNHPDVIVKAIAPGI